MKLLKVTLYNLASLEGLQEIDFESEPLRSADLFSIVGETGSGKSTILDAICLALYGTAPRFEDARNFKYYRGEAVNRNQTLLPNDPRNILRRGAKSCSAEVWFQARDGARYRATWSCAFARTNYKREERHFYRLTRLDSGAYTEEELPIQESGGRSNAGLDQVIGLDYSQFTRTVMLAQNSFANFIKAKDEEKAVLLEKLTGTRIYAVIAEKINAYYKEAKLAKEELEREIGAYRVNCLSDERLAEVVQEKKALDNAWAELDKAIKRLEEQAKWRQRTAELWTVLEEERKRLEAARAESEAIQEKRLRLKVYDLALPIQRTFLSCQQTLQRQASLEKRLETLSATFPQMIQQVAAQKRLLDQVSEQVRLAKQRQQEMAPRLTLARRRKLEWENTRQQGVEAAKRTQVARQHESDSLHQLQENVKASRANEEASRNAESLLAQLVPHQALIDTLEVVVNRLAAFKKARDERDQLLETLQKDTQSLAETSAALTKSQKILVDLKAKDEALSRQQMDWQAALERYDLGALQKNSAEATKRRQDGERLHALYEASRKNQADLAAAKVEIQALEKRLAAWLATGQALAQERDAIQKVLPGLEEAYRLAAGKNAEAMRAALRPGEPCPVCGSREHPFAERDAAYYLSPIKAEIIQKRNRLVEIGQALEHPETGVRNAYAQGITRKGQLLGLEESLEKEYERLRSEWMDLRKSYADLLDWRTTEEARWRAELNRFQERAKREEAEAVALFKNYQDQQTRLARSRRESAQLKETVMAQDKECQTLETRAASLRARSLERQAQLTKQNHTLDQEKEALGERLASIPDWERRFLGKDEGGLAWLRQLGEDYAQAMKRQQACAERRGQLLLLAETLKEQQVKARAQRTDCERQQANIQAEIVVRERAYRDVLGGKDPDQLEQELNEAVATQERRLEQANQTYSRSREDHDRLDENLKLLRKELVDNQSKGQELAGEIQAWLDRYNQSAGRPLELNQALLAELFAPDRDWTALRNAIKRVDEAVQQALGRVENSQRNLALHERLEIRTDDSLETLQSRIQEKISQREGLDTQRQEVSGLLAAHEKAIVQVANRKAELDSRERTFQDWSELNSILGNAEGNRFRETAQCFTLRFLIQQANVQLRLLNPRYSLEQVKDSLGIRVVDHDRADEVRNLSSLSGGETFLVSLGLALGLSTLSSRNIQISNLFVDEGFGSLDPDSLNIVIDALSSLRTMQGKKVGVISHTPEMRERIHTRIQVVKMGASGRSQLRIV